MNKTVSQYRKLAGAAIAAMVLSAGTASAFDLGTLGVSAGGQAAVKSNFGGGLKMDHHELDLGYFGYGVNAFIDIKYLEVGLGLTFGTITWDVVIAELEGSFTSLDFSVLAKYPIELSSMSVFPAVGIESQQMSSIEIPAIFTLGVPVEASDFNRFWFKFGGGLDFSLNDKLYFRGTALYGIGLANKFEDDGSKDDDTDTIMSHGIDIRVGLGFKI